MGHQDIQEPINSQLPSDKYRAQRYAGKKITRYAKIAVAIDQSGSVGDEAS